MSELSTADLSVSTVPRGRQSRPRRTKGKTDQTAARRIFELGMGAKDKRRMGGRFWSVSQYRQLVAKALRCRDLGPEGQ